MPGNGQDDKTAIVVNKKAEHVAGTTTSADEIRDLADAPDDYEVWHVVKDPDPEGQLPVDDEQVTGEIKIDDGDRFRVVPPGTFGGHE